MAHFPKCLEPTQDDIAKMLACEVHIGTKNLDPQMGRYMWKRKTDGHYIINLQKTWEKLTLAARVIAAVENPQDVCIVSARPYGQRAVLKIANFINAHAISGRFTPGTFTNQIQEKFLEPRLLLVTDPRTDDQPLRESAYVNIPTIAFCDSDSSLRNVDIAIPCNNRSKHSIGLMYYLLCREVMFMKGLRPRAEGWDVMVDLFFYRDPDEQDKVEEAFEDQAAASFPRPAANALFDQPSVVGGAPEPSGDWGQPAADQVDPNWAPPQGEWGAVPPAQAPPAEWTGDQAAMFQGQAPPADAIPAGWGSAVPPTFQQ